MSIEESEIFRRVAHGKADRRRLIIRVVTQSIIMAFFVLAVSLFVTAVLVVKVFHLVNLMPMAVVCVAVTMLFTVIGMILISLWNPNL